MSRWSRGLTYTLILVLSLVGCRRAPSKDVPVVAAAADLQFALEEVAQHFSAGTGLQVKLAFGSSGQFARQLEQGAPFQLFMSADEAFVTRLSQAGRTMDAGTLYAIGRIGLFVPRGSPLKADGSLEDLRVALKDGRLRSFAIANPEHAPYGQRAEEALRRAGLWETIRPKLVLGENASQAAQFTASGSAQGGILAYSLARLPRIAEAGTFALIPAEWHRPLAQRMVLMKGAGPAAKAFYVYLQQPEARGILQKHGFVLPDERP
ncbi:molybdate ABC transporter substrate-binding protein [Geothrix limicola]|uniref:Molybdate ABC transporter substrate-binding protein n=1 Tax=Geothrix limicola TaxID=2927978 RepID=A0ABQ5QCE5_9BACT|nr:molybdate ABC transporter substrate-binding protein [Geothrix limicola]GLH72258.1 molybdate ABC transporter substrate-binding protein [Geothrix limicola]